MKVLGLDISSTCTGVSKLIWNEETDNIELVEVTHIKPKTTLNLYQRLKVIDEQMLERGFYDWADLIVIEGFAYAGTAVVQLAQVNGVVRYQLSLRDKEFCDIAPTSVKKLITGNGRAKKPEVRAYLKNIPLFEGVDFKNDDESDSAAIAYAHIKRQILEKNQCQSKKATRKSKR